MKKLIALVLMVTYTACAVGFTFSFHYCGGHYKQICFTADTENGCCEGNEHKSNCCEDKVIKAKFKSDQSSSAKVFLLKVFSPQAVLNQYVVFQQIITHENYQTYVSNDSSPPITSGVPIYLMNRVFRI
ncbi:MAG: hypothetical protein H7257_04250 [Taibaiella sp.]|nr:hypothetical protein [Taibaiella sp.]